MKPNKMLLPPRMILPMVCCIPLMNSCATDKPMEKPAWNIQPVYKVNNVAADNPEALYKVGRYYQGQRRYEQAIESYRRALAADSNFVEAHNGLGVIYSMQGQYDAAVTEFKLAIGQSPKSGHLYNNLGHTLYLHGAYIEAVSALEQAVNLDPGNVRALKNLGLAYAKTGDVAKSREMFVEAAIPVSENSIAAVPKTPAQTNVAPVVQAEASTTAAQVVATQTPATPISTVPKLPEREPVVQVPVVQVPVVQKSAVQEPAVQEPVVQKPIVKESTAPVPAVQTPEPQVQTLALPKDRGVITPAPVAVTPSSNIEPNFTTGQVAPNVDSQNVTEPGANEPVISKVNVPEASKPAEPMPVAENTKGTQPDNPVIREAVTEVATFGLQPQPSVTVQADSAVSRIVGISQALLHLEVSNGNGTTGMARKVATYLQEIGYEKARLTNRKPFTVQTTQIQYRSGHEADAEYLRASLPNNLPTPAAIVQSNSLRDDINLRMVLGKDLVQHTAYFNGITQRLIVRND